MRRRLFFPLLTFVMKDGVPAVVMIFGHGLDNPVEVRTTLRDYKSVGWEFDKDMTAYEAVQQVYGEMVELTDRDVEIGDTPNEYARYIIEEALVKHRFKLSLTIGA